MRQTHLLQSFLKKQNKKSGTQQQQTAQKSQSHSKEIKNCEQSQQQSLYQQQQKQLEQRETPGRRSKKIGSKSKNLCQDYHNSRQREKKSKSGKKNTKGKSKSKGKKQNQAINAKSSTKQSQATKKQQDPLAHFTDATPIWAQKQHCKDKNLRSASDPLYDPTTLHVPAQAWSKFTAPMKQFWKIKSQNFDKVIFFKLGKFYQLFYDDAAIGNKYLELKYMGTKMHSGFPEKCLDKYATELVQLGFKVVVVQQMETPAQMQHRVTEDKKHGRKSQKTINRDVTQILTKGTHTTKQQKQTSYLPNYLLSLRVYGDIFGFSLLQIGTNQIIMGTVDSVQKFKTLLFQTRPAQLVYDPDNLSYEICQMMSKTFLQIQMSRVINKNNIWHPLNFLAQLNRLEKQQKIQNTKIFQIIEGFQDINKNLIHSTLSGLFQYLKRVLKFEYVINSVRFSFYQKDSHSKNMILDSQALQHLQIFQTSDGQKGSLFNIIDRTKTKFGKRLLRKWLISPLMNQHHINQRLNALQDIQNLPAQRRQISSILKKLPDLDIKVNRLYHYAIKTTSASKAIYFQDLNTARLKQFRQVMQKMEEAWKIISLLGKKVKQFKSVRLRQLVILMVDTSGIRENQFYGEDEDDQSVHIGLMPNVMNQLNQFQAYVKWQGNVPVPQKGLVSQYDQLHDSMQKIKKQLEEFIDKLRYQMHQPNLKFTHIKERYQIQVPEKADKKKPRDFQFTSKRAGFSRYICPGTTFLVKKLQRIEQSVKQQMGLFIGFFFQQFKKKQKIWQRYIQILAEIDCLISLSQYSFHNNKTRPNFDKNIFQIRGAKHPCLTNIDFIPNDIVMRQKVMLLTGPNMGGKSTILRTVCCLAILAQIGCYVPADYYNCQTIDRIFTRIGASDKLQLGKSTFFIQMQQTKNVLLNASSKSLAIIDQLGRGTSTFDGLAIAYSVLRSIIQNIKCYCFFATHYHILIDQFKDRQQVKLMKMDCILKQNQITFLYKLVPGNVIKSFGLSVASRVGLSKTTLNIAQNQANKMNKYIDGKRKAALNMVIKFMNEDK